MSLRELGDHPTICREKSLTRQSEAAQADINVIMARYDKTGVLPTDAREALFADVSDIGDFRQAQETLRLAEIGFMALPAAARARFENDPIKLMEFISGAATEEELVELGLVEKAQEAAPVAPGKPPAGA